MPAPQTFTPALQAFMPARQIFTAQTNKNAAESAAFFTSEIEIYRPDFAALALAALIVPFTGTVTIGLTLSLV